ncbi:MAG: cyclopropane fatty acyl phospholipid synthase [Gemmatimonadota bacterium]
MPSEDPSPRARGPTRSGFFSEPRGAEAGSKVEPHEPGRSTERGATVSGRSAPGGIARQIVQKRLLEAGVQVNGTAAHDPQVADARFYRRVLRDGSLGLGESYVEGWWETDAIDAFIHRIVAADLARRARRRGAWTAASWIRRLRNPQSRRRASRNARSHYEKGSGLFRAMLDRRMTYSCGYWKEARTLDEAQEAKLDLICRKLRLKEGATLLDIGCGWGSLVAYAAERYGVRATGVTVSPEQAEVARATCRGLPVEIRVQDYRGVNGQYDAVVSVGMFEHVGPRNYRTYMEVVRRSLAPDGLSLLHTITGNAQARAIDPWIARYIFPGAVLPTLGQIAKATERLLVIEDVHGFGPDYDRTLLAWHRRFEDAWPILEGRYDERFRRLWTYYLLSSAGAFRARGTQVLQLLLTPPGRMRPDGADVR